MFSNAEVDISTTHTNTSQGEWALLQHLGCSKNSLGFEICLLVYLDMEVIDFLRIHAEKANNRYSGLTGTFGKVPGWATLPI